MDIFSWDHAKKMTIWVHIKTGEKFVVDMEGRFTSSKFLDQRVFLAPACHCGV